MTLTPPCCGSRSTIVYCDHGELHNSASHSAVILVPAGDAHHCHHHPRADTQNIHPNNSERQSNSERQNNSDIQVLFSVTLAAVQHKNPPSKEPFYNHYLLWTPEMAECFPIRANKFSHHTAAGDNMRTVFVWVQLRSQQPWLPCPTEHIKNKIKTNIWNRRLK